MMLTYLKLESQTFSLSLSISLSTICGATQHNFEATKLRNRRPNQASTTTVLISITKLTASIILSVFANAEILIKTLSTKLSQSNYLHCLKSIDCQFSFNWCNEVEMFVLQTPELHSGLTGESTFYIPPLYSHSFFCPLLSLDIFSEYVPFNFLTTAFRCKHSHSPRKHTFRINGIYSGFSS